MQSHQTLLSIEQLSRLDKASGRVFFEKFSASIQTGDQILLEGQSGSGKSLLLRALAFLDLVQEGTLVWQDRVVKGAYVPFYRSQVHYVAQTPSLEGETVHDMLQYPWRLALRKQQIFPEERLQRYLQAIEKSADFLKLSIASLSGGEKQLCQLLQALLIKPSILLLDEPTSALDIHKVELVESLLHQWIVEEPNRAWIWVSHDEAQKSRIANRHWYIQDGKILEKA